MKTIFISVFQSFISRNILNTGVLDLFLEKGMRVVLFVPPAKEIFYRETYTHPNIEIESFDSESFVDKKENFLKNLCELLINTNVIRFRMMKKHYLVPNFPRYVCQRMIIALFGNSKIVKNIFRKIDLEFNNKDAFNHFFKKYKPDVVFAPDVFGLADVLLLKSAKIHGVPTIGEVASWDNNTTKGLMRVIPDHLLVQNEIIKDESIKIQNVSEEKIEVVGIPHYDYYREYKPISREAFFEKLGLDPKKRLIMFSPAGDKFIGTDWQICEILKNAYAKGEISDDVITLIRVHPTNPVSFKDFTPDRHFFIETPGVNFEGAGDKKKELDKEGLSHLLDTLAHTDVVINVVSSMVIDAAVFNKPVITIGFEGWEKEVPFPHSVERYQKDENMAKLLAIGGTAWVRSPQELVKWVNRYLNHPEIDSEGRQKILKIQCWKLDGKAKERIVDAVLSRIKK